MTEKVKGKYPEITEVSDSIKNILQPAFDILNLHPIDEKEYILDLHKIIHEIVKGSHYRFDNHDVWDLLNLDCVFIATRDSWLKNLSKNLITITRIATNLDKPIIDVFIHDDEGHFKFDVRIVKPKNNKGKNKWF